MKMVVMDEAVDRKNVGVSAIKDDPLLNMRPTIHCLHGTICVACEIVGKQNNTETILSFHNVLFPYFAKLWFKNVSRV